MVMPSRVFGICNYKLVSYCTGYMDCLSMKALITILFSFFVSVSSGADYLIKINSLSGHQTFFNVMGDSKFENGVPESTDANVDSETKILCTGKGFFISHNNGMKELFSKELGPESMLLQEFDSTGMLACWTVHFGQKNDKNQVLVTCVRTRSSYLFVSTMQMWGWADIIKQS